MQLDTIKLYCDVIQHQSMSDGAQINGITQSAASQRIAAMERELGVKLINRSKRPLEPTEAGKVYLIGGRKIFDQHERLRREIALTADGYVELRGEVTITSIYSAGIDLLNQIETGFESLHHKVQVRIEYHQPETVHDKVCNNQCDFGIIAYPKQWRGVGWKLLREELMVVVCCPGHPLTEHETVKPDELNEYPMVMFDTRLPIRRHLNAFLSRHGVVPHIAHSFDNIDTIKSCIVDSKMVAILPKRTVLREVAAGVLASVSLTPVQYRPLGIIYHGHGRTNNEHFSPVAQAFVDYLIDHTGVEE